MCHSLWNSTTPAARRSAAKTRNGSAPQNGWCSHIDIKIHDFWLQAEKALEIRVGWSHSGSGEPHYRHVATDWTAPPSQKQGEAITGIAIRVKPPYDQDYNVSYEAAFPNGQVQAANNGAVVGIMGGDLKTRIEMLRLRVWLHHR